MNTNGIETVSLIKTPFNLEGREVVCYPYIISAVKLLMPRPFMKPRVAHTVITTDMVKGTAARSNMYPETTEIEIGESALIPSLVTHEEATKEIRKLSLKWAMYKFHVMRTPEIEIVSEIKAYKAFFYADINDERQLVDSVKGIEEQGIKLKKKT